MQDTTNDSSAACGQSALTDGLGVTRAKHRAQWAEFLRNAARETRETGRVYALIADYECNLIAAHLEEADGWKEAAIAWEVCASVHEKWAKGKDALYSTRHADFVKHADDARARFTTPNVQGQGRLTADSSPAGVPLERRVGPDDSERN